MKKDGPDGWRASGGGLRRAAAGASGRPGQFWAEPSAFTSLAIIVPVIVGWLTRKQLITGLTSGALK
jgi:ABC-type glycerol-3-phosphate transport system permease component